MDVCFERTKRENKGQSAEWQRDKARKNGEWRIGNGEMAEPRHPFSLWARSPLAGEKGRGEPTVVRVDNSEIEVLMLNGAE
jgi:hypothetical protein